MCLQVLFLGPASPATFGLLSEKLVVSPVLRVLTLGRVLPYVQSFVSDVCSDWPDIRQFLACHYSGLVPATTLDFRRAFGFAFTKEALRNTRSAGKGEIAPVREGGLEGMGDVLKAFGLERLLAGFSRGGADARRVDDEVDALAGLPEEDFATLNAVNDFVVKYGLADTSKGGRWL